jgi:hypothetical protein
LAPDRNEFGVKPPLRVAGVPSESVSKVRDRD